MYNNGMAVVSFGKIKSCVKKVAEVYGVRSVTLFGSYAEGKNTSKSDIDLLVDFGSEARSYFDVFGFQNELEELIGKSVDVVIAPIPKDSFLEIGTEILLYAA